jgi:hypothetical protein
MSDAGWEDLKEEICTELLLGKENGEVELETMALMVWPTATYGDDLGVRREDGLIWG